MRASQSGSGLRRCASALFSTKGSPRSQSTLLVHLPHVNAHLSSFPRPTPRLLSDENDELFYDEDEVLRGADADERAAALEDRFEAMLQMDAGRFADDDEEDGEEVRRHAQSCHFCS